MAKTLAARLVHVKETPIIPPELLAALSGQGDLPEDLSDITEDLSAEAEQVSALRARLSDVPPEATSHGSVLL